jgi:hypothetical protein
VSKTLRLYSQLIVTLLISLIIVYSLGEFHHYDRSLAVVYRYAEEKDNISHSNNHLVTIADNDVFGNLAKQFDSFTKQFEYKVDLDGKQIFPNDMIKQDIVTNYKSSNYSISSLKYRLLGFNITASDIRIHVNPSKIDTVKTKINFPLIFARNVTVNNGLINLRYYEINLGSIYGIYDKITDKMTMHIPIRIALQYIPHNA